MIERGFLVAAEGINGAVPGERTEDHAMAERQIAGDGFTAHQVNGKRGIDALGVGVFVRVLIVILVFTRRSCRSGGRSSGGSRRWCGRCRRSRTRRRSWRRV